MAQIKELLFFTYELQWVNKSPRRSSSTAVFLEPMEPMEPMWMEACSFSNYSFHSCAEVVSILPSWGGGECARRVFLGGVKEPLAIPDCGEAGKHLVVAPGEGKSMMLMSILPPLTNHISMLIGQSTLQRLWTYLYCPQWWKYNAYFLLSSSALGAITF